jgi:hypothetical protein
MTRTLLLLVALLSACDSPAPAMMGAEAGDIVVDGVAFTVRQRDTRAEAIRRTMMPNPSIGTVYPRALRAMQEVTGCRVIEDSLRGDVAVMRADLDCH